VQTDDDRREQYLPAGVVHEEDPRHDAIIVDVAGRLMAVDVAIADPIEVMKAIGGVETTVSCQDYTALAM
jgi:hypothetical protein